MARNPRRKQRFFDHAQDKDYTSFRHVLVEDMCQRSRPFSRSPLSPTGLSHMTPSSWKAFCLAECTLPRLIIAVSLVLILKLVYGIIVIMLTTSSGGGRGSIDEDGQGKWRVSTEAIPDMVDFMTWGTHGSGVKVVLDTLHPGRISKRAPEESLQSPKLPVPSSHAHKDELRVLTASEEIIAEMQKAHDHFGLNVFISNRISLRRTLPDVREKQCLESSGKGSNLDDSDRLDDPLASVIIDFKEEPRSVLLRAVFSVLDRSPAHVLKEILLVDRGSPLEDLSYPVLERYLSAISPKIRVLRSWREITYAEARNYGLDNASGATIVFLSARCECSTGWLQPLINHVSHTPYSIAVPVVDTIDGVTFEYQKTPSDDMSVSSFTWDLNVRRLKLMDYFPPNHEIMTSPLTSLFSPVIGHGIFAAKRSLLIRLGGFSATLEGKSIADIELSFRAWMCGRTIELVRCSRVGLVSFTSGHEELVKHKDKAAVAHWWMGDEQVMVHERLETPGEHLRWLREASDDIQEHNYPRRDLHCHDFRWFLRTLEPSRLIQGRVTGSGWLQQGRGLRLRVTSDRRVITFANYTSAKDQANYQNLRQKFQSSDPLEDSHNPLEQDRNLIHLQQWARKTSPADESADSDFWYLTDDGQLMTGNSWCLVAQEVTLDFSRAVAAADVNDAAEIKEEINMARFVVKGSESQAGNLGSPAKQIPKPIPNQNGGGRDKADGSMSGRQRADVNETRVKELSYLITADGGGKVQQGSNLTSNSEENSIRAENEVGGERGGNQHEQEQPRFWLSLAMCGQVYPPVQWLMREDTCLEHIPTGLCLVAGESLSAVSRTHALDLKPCDADKDSQRWRFSHKDPLAKVESILDRIRRESLERESER